MPARIAAVLGSALALAGSLAATPAVAQTTYDFASYPFTFQFGATAATVTVTTSFLGGLGDEAAIEALLNSSSYSADLRGAGGTLTHLDNSNSRWELNFAGAGASAWLDVGATGMTLTYTTPQEFSGANLLLRSFDNLSVLQYQQNNNVSDSNAVLFTYNAISGASYFLPYASTFAMPAAVAAIPEPEVLSSLALGLVLMRWTMRKRRRTA